MRKKVVKIILHLFGVLLFIFVTAYALLAAYGYQIDLLQRNIIKTSIIDLNNKLEDVMVFLNGELVAQDLPFQIKNLKPGKYNLEVIKDKYISWKKSVEVKEDIVTKVDDILMIPLDIESVAEELIPGFEFEEFIYNDTYILFISYKLNKLVLYKMDQKGTFTIENINYKIDEFDGDIYFVNSHYVAFSKPNEVLLLNLIDKSKINIIVPDEFSDFKLAFDNKITGFYINDSDLYTVDISNDGSFQKITLLEEDINTEDSNFKIVESQGQIFILWKGSLYHFQNEKIIKLDNNVKSIPLVSPDYKYAIYLKIGEELILYDLNNEEKEVLGRFSYPIVSTYWFKDSKHVFLAADDSVLLCDFDFLNCNNLINLKENQSIIIFPYNSNLISIEKDILKIYDLATDL